MGKKYYETSEFKNLQKDWYSKLGEEGFKDVENESDVRDRVVKTQIFKIDPKGIAYMSRCRQYLHSGKITDKLDLFILEKHCEGLTQKETVELLKENGLRVITRQALSLRLEKILESANIEPFEFPSGR